MTRREAVSTGGRDSGVARQQLSARPAPRQSNRGRTVQPNAKSLAPSGAGMVRDAKFGIWAHWGPQSALEAGDWYARNMYIETEAQYKYHLEHYGHPSKFGYKDLIPLWKGAKFDPQYLMGCIKGRREIFHEHGVPTISTCGIPSITNGMPPTWVSRKMCLACGPKPRANTD